MNLQKHIWKVKRRLSRQRHCHRGWRPEFEFNTWDPYDGEKELSSPKCPLTSTGVSWHMHLYLICHTHKQYQRFFFNLKNKVKFIPIPSALAETGWLSQQQPAQLGHGCSDPLNSVLNFIWEIRGHPNPLKAELLCFCDISPALDEISILLVIKGETQETIGG